MPIKLVTNFLPAMMLVQQAKDTLENFSLVKLSVRTTKCCIERVVDKVLLLVVHRYWSITAPWLPYAQQLAFNCRNK